MVSLSPLQRRIFDQRVVNDIERSEQVSRPCPRSDAAVDLPGTDTDPDEGDLHLAHLAGRPQNSTVRPVGPDLQLGGEVGPEIVGAPENDPNAAAIRLPAAREPRETLVGGGHPRVETFPERMLVITQVVNCTSCNAVTAAVRRLRRVTDLPIGGYASPVLDEPEGGEPEFDISKPVGPNDYAAIAKGWVADGATVIGGCCDTNPDFITALRRMARP